MDVSCGADPCPVILKSTCVFYTGSYLSSIGVTTNDNFQTVVTKINQAFQNSGLGYDFNNGITQPDLSQPVQLGGSLIKDTIISGGYTLSLIGNLQATKHVTTGGTSFQFVKGDGSLDSIIYQPSGNYLTGLSGDGVANGPGVGTFTLATVNSSPGTFGNGANIPVVTVNGKGLVTSIVSTPIAIPPQPLLFTGDVVGSGVTGTAVTLSLQNVNANVYNTNTLLKFSVGLKGIVTSADPITEADIISVLGYTPVRDTRTLTINNVTYDLSANRSWTIGTTALINLSTIGNSGVATWNSTTAVLNVPEYTLNGLGGVPLTRTLSINNVLYDLTSNRNWTVGDIRSDQTYINPNWINSLNWNKITNTPTTLLGYGVTEVYAPINNPIFTGSVTLPGTPLNPLEAATKQYVDDVSQGLHIHPSCVTATNANLVALYSNGVSGVGATLINNGAQAPLMIDGVTVAPTNRVLVKNQSSQLQNGIYTVTDIGSLSSNWILTRASDFNESSEINGGDFVFVTGGITNDNTGWVQTETLVNIGVSNISFTQFSGAGTYQAGNGLLLTGNVFSINTAITVDLTTSQTLSNKTITGSFTGNLSGNASTVTDGVYTTGSYPNPSWITSLAWSKISSTPTTLAGYGITDAVPATRTITINGTTFDLSADRNWTIAAGISGTIATGQVAFGTAANTIGGSNNLFWDSVNSRLGIGTSTPSVQFHLNTSIAGENFRITGANNTSVKFITDSGGRSFMEVTGQNNYPGGAYFTARGFQEAWFNVISLQALTGNKHFRFGNVGESNFFAIQKLADDASFVSATPFVIHSASLNVGINQLTDAGFRLDVGGTVKSSGAISVQLPTAGSFLNIFRAGSTSITALTASIVSDNVEWNTSNATQTFFSSSSPRFFINGGTSAIISSSVGGTLTSATNIRSNGPVEITTGVPANSNTINYGLLFRQTASTGIRLVVGLDFSENVVIALANANLRIYETNSNNDLLNINRTTGNVSIQTITGAHSSIPSAKLAVTSTNSGFLPPRMTLAQRNAISTPENGLIVYNTTDNIISVYNGTTWLNLATL